MADIKAGFVFDEKQAEYIKRAFETARDILHDYMNVDDEQRSTYAVQVEMAQAVATAFKDKRISCKTLRKHYDRLNGLKYWSAKLTQIGIGGGKGKRTVYGYEIVSNLPEINGKTVRTDNTNAFNKNIPEDIAEQARQLRIPDGVLFVSDAEIFALEYMRPVWLYVLADKQDTSPYKWTANTAASNAFTNIGALSVLNADEMQAYDDRNRIVIKHIITGTKGVKIYTTDEGFKLSFLSAGIDMLYTQLLQKAIEVGSKTVPITLDEYMSTRGLKDRSSADEQLKKELLGLKHSEIGFTGSAWEKGKGKEVFGIVSILQAVYGISSEERSKGRKIEYVAQFSEAVFEDMKAAPKKLLPQAALKIPSKRPNAWKIVNEFSTAYRTNGASNRPQTCRLSVKKLLDMLTYPPYETLADKGQAGQRIIRPFLRDMDLIEELGIFSYQLQHKQIAGGRVELTDDELDRYETDYTLFSSLIVEVKWLNPPDYSNLKEKQMERLEQANKPKRGRPKAKKK